MPTKKSPDINNMSTIEFPERLLNIGANAPSGANFRNPDVGETPESHDLSEAVAKPRPNSLSKNAQSIINEIESLNSCQILFSVKYFTRQL